MIIQFSPYTRGWTRDARIDARSDGVFPVHAGMDL